jgi:MOSC domain-containing protein YiiM
MCRGLGGRREILSEAVLGVNSGVPGDAWGRAAERNRKAQITVMQQEVAELIANGQPIALFGDNLIVELDLSADNLPPGSRIRVGKAILEVTPKPHNGCHKFQARFGEAALRLVSKPELRHRNLRGIYMRAIQDGSVHPGDSIEVLARAEAAAKT